MKKLYVVTASVEILVRAESESEAEQYAKLHAGEIGSEFDCEAEEIHEPRFLSKAYDDCLPWRGRQDDGGKAHFGHELTCAEHFVRELPEDPRQGKLLDIEPMDPDCGDCDGGDFWHHIECPRAGRLLNSKPSMEPEGA